MARPTPREAAMSTLVDFPVKPEARPYLDAFTGTAGEPEWLARFRQHGLSRFAELGFPTRRSENWRYLDLQPLERQPLLPMSTPRREQPAILDELRLPSGQSQTWYVLVDGKGLAGWPRRVALPPGVWCGPLSVTITERPELVRALLRNAEPDHPFAALNAAFFADGFLLDVEPGVIVDRPIEFIHLATDAKASLHTRSLINLGAGSRATVIEIYAGSGKYWRNDVTAWRLGDGASLTRVALIEESPEAVHLGEIAVTLGAKARLDGFALLLGGGTVRHEANVTIAGDKAECRYDGAFVVSGREEANIVTTVDHAAVGGTTTELIKGVAAGRGHGAFQGKIIVREGAQQTDARQTSRNLILGRRAVIDTKPELQILADDVKCAHGASVGDLDEAALFYLRARGIPTDEARRLLVEGFLREPVEGIADPAIREHLLRRLAARLARLEDE
jgi:Fe-S cluster assembly protein SufD